MFRYLANDHLAIGATILLVLHQFTAVAGAARRVSGTAAGTLPEVGRLGTQLVADASLALVVLLVTTTLSVYKPWGRTGYGRRKQQQERGEIPGGTLISTPRISPDPDKETIGKTLPLGLKIFLAVISVIVAVFAVLHLTGGGLGSHGN